MNNDNVLVLVNKEQIKREKTYFHNTKTNLEKVPQRGFKEALVSNNEESDDEE